MGLLRPTCETQSVRVIPFLYLPLPENSLCVIEYQKSTQTMLNSLASFVVIMAEKYLLVQ